MKRLIVTALASAGAAFAVYRKVQAGKAEQDLWAEATDPVA